ncbi:MAG: PA14 domain-containing protein, partial [Verrucomicrobia bacterium]|nr:PA14 domain-containing protein [Verrucomicrobiota bacterium]
MSISIDPTLRNLNDCGCCAGVTVETPAEVRPGLAAIAYRVGTHALFKKSLLARLSGSDLPALRGLKTRDDDDFSIALLDSWATVADVLTFYQERIANESYLRTATERLSLLQLGRLIGYELRPGVAASVDLAFTVEEAKAPGVPDTVTIDAGTKVQSIPGPGEQPQTFETIEKIDARADWNGLKPKTTELRTPITGDQKVYLKGVSTNLKVGDGLLFVGGLRVSDPNSGQWDFRIIESVAANQAGGYTLVTWSKPLEAAFDSNANAPLVYALRQRAALFGANAPDWRTMPISVRRPSVPGNLVEGLFAEYFNSIDLTNRVLARIDPSVNFDWGLGSPDSTVTADNFSVRWSGFVTPPASGQFTFFTSSDDGVRLWVDGQLLINNWTDHSNTENKGTIHLEADRLYDLRLEYYEKTGAALISLSWSGPGQSKAIIPSSAFLAVQLPDEWPNFNIAYKPSVPADLDTVYLDAIYPKIVPGLDSWLVLTTPDYVELYRVIRAVDDSRVAFTLSSKTTRLQLLGENLQSQFAIHLRDTVVFGQSELLAYAEQPLTSPPTLLPLGDGTLAPVEGSQIALDHVVQGLTVGQRVIVSGKPMHVLITGAIFSGDIVPDEGNAAFSVR